MNQTTPLASFLFALIIASASIANAQNSYHIFFPSQGKDILAASVDGHSYKIVSINDKQTQLYVDNKEIEHKDWSRYDAITDKIKSAVTSDDAEEARDMAQAQRDREQGERDRQQGQRDREQAQRDREQARFDRGQARYDEASGEVDAEQGQRDRELAAEDRANLKKLIQYLVDQKLVPDTRHLVSIVITDTAMTINGATQSPEVYKTLRDRFGSWARHGLSYDTNGSFTVND